MVLCSFSSMSITSVQKGTEDRNKIGRTLVRKGLALKCSFSTFLLQVILVEPLVSFWLIYEMTQSCICISCSPQDKKTLHAFLFVSFSESYSQSIQKEQKPLNINKHKYKEHGKWFSTGKCLGNIHTITHRSLNVCVNKQLISKISSSWSPNCPTIWLICG